MKKIILMCLVFLFSLHANSSFALESGIVTKIEPVLAEYSAQDKLDIKISYTNVSSENVRFLKWNTALVGSIQHDFLSVVFDGAELPYIGIHIKRLPPTSRDFITLSPGETISAVVDLSKAYALKAGGQYTLLYRGLNHSNVDFKTAAGVIINLVEPRASAPTVKRPPIIDASCTAQQTNQINEALGIAERISITAINDLNNAPVDKRASARRYREWFGAYSASRYQTVSRGMSKISSALVNRQIGFDCGCNDPNVDRNSTFAYVYSNDPYYMNVCSVFFRTTAAGTDSRAGTIIHEISHFNVVAGSDDFQSALDQSGSRNLANTNPNNAIKNANAFEYFAENTPFLTMPAASVTPEPEPEPESEIKKVIITPILPLLLDE